MTPTEGDKISHWIHVNNEMPPRHPIQGNFSLQVIIMDQSALGIFKEPVIDISRYNYQSLTWLTTSPFIVTHWCFISDYSYIKIEGVSDIRRSNSDERKAKRMKQDKAIKNRIANLTTMPKPKPMKYFPEQPIGDDFDSSQPNFHEPENHNL